MQFAALEGQQKELAAAPEDPAAYTPGGHANTINRDLSPLCPTILPASRRNGKASPPRSALPNDEKKLRVDG
jgi:hypothetical protein